ncbi:MAG: glycosyltransferase, partial [Candidatus Krumholzibacteria bacterium]|nr:glycosyltransferase [Candidatus Krumholzibacteria bacterium]
MKKILFIGGTTGGGVATINNEVIRIFDNSGHSYELVDTEAMKARFPALLAYLFSYVVSLVKIISARPYTVYLQLAQTGYLHQSFFLLIAKMFRRETIAHFHAKADLKSTCTRAQLGRIIFSQRYTDKMIVLSEPCRQSLLRSGWKKDVFVIPNFINTENLPTDIRPVTERSQLLYIGRMSREKGILEILEVAQRLQDENFLFVGNFEDERTEREFKQKLDKLDNARWLGPMYSDEKFRVIADSRLLIFPTRRDEFPMTLIESSILGCVPLVSPVGSVREIIKDGYNGYYISPDDIEGIIDRIKSIVSGVRPSFDKIVVSMHWGEECTNIPPSYVLYQPVASPMHDAYIKEVTEYLADCYEEADAGAYDETVRRNVSAGHNKNRIRMRVRMLSHFWNY